MLDFKKIENICAIVLIVAFFLPWVSFGGMLSFAGYQIPNALEVTILCILGWFFRAEGNKWLIEL